MTTRLIDIRFLQIRLLQQLLLVLLFSGLLSVAFLDKDKFTLAWIAFVPLLFAIENATLVRTYFLGLFAGLCLFLSGTYWIADFINIAKDSNHSSNLWLACIYWLYCAHQIAFLVLLLNWLRKHSKIHDFLLFPIVLASFTSAFPMIFPMRIGESQIGFHSALQATEFFGVHALDAIMALFNIIVFRFLSKRVFIPSDQSTKHKTSNNAARYDQSVWPLVLGISLIALWFIYGVTEYYSWEKRIASWDTLKVGLIQPNEVPTLGIKTPYPGFSQAYPPEMEMSERLASIGADLIIWPEANPKGYLDSSTISSAYQKNIGSLGATLIFQDLKSIRDPINGKILSRYNSAIMLNNQGHQAGLYNKIKRIPFGEYIPLLSDNSTLNMWTEDYLGAFLNTTLTGEKHQLFLHDKINIVPLICYETAFPYFVGNAVSDTAAQANTANGTVLIALSNDGWFGSSHQPYQHVMASVLRAVENRLPLVHVANNGPSIVVTPHGKIIFTTDFQQAGGYIANIPHSDSAQGSFFSRHPRLFTNVLYALLAFMVFNAILRKTRST